MKQRNAKIFRKLFKDRRQYRAFKREFSNASLEKRIEVLKVARGMISSKKEINTITAEKAVQKGM